MPLSTRRRNDAARGAQPLKHPAQARLNMPHSSRRVASTKIKSRNFIRGQRDFVRPHLKRMGRGSTSGRRGRGVTRPAYRADRPKRFRW
jgi:hypothetical protein